MPAYGRMLILYLFWKAAGQGCRARLPGKAAGQGCRARLPGKAADQGCRTRLPGKTAGQWCMQWCNMLKAWWNWTLLQYFAPRTRKNNLKLSSFIIPKVRPLLNSPKNPVWKNVLQLLKAKSVFSWIVVNFSVLRHCDLMTLRYGFLLIVMIVW
jgi:hypothetical protein